MVFESLVVDLVNRFLGDYIDNLDKSQLSLGLWGGVSRSIFMCVRLIYTLLVLRLFQCSTDLCTCLYYSRCI